jgi:hypothetical protein
MSIISYKNNFIFLKTRKTAGTSIQASLKPICDSKDIVTYGWINEITGEKSKLSEFFAKDEIEKELNIDFDSFFTFGFTRNPFDLVLSRYFYEIKRKRLIQFANKVNFNIWLKLKYIKNKEYIQDRSRYLLFDDNLESVVNYIGRFETLENDFHFIKCNFYNYYSIKLQHLNKSNFNNIHYHDWFSQDNKKLISKYFAFEIDYFKYRF